MINNEDIETTELLKNELIGLKNLINKLSDFKNDPVKKEAIRVKALRKHRKRNKKHEQKETNTQ